MFQLLYYLNITVQPNYLIEDIFLFMCYIVIIMIIVILMVLINYNIL